MQLQWRQDPSELSPVYGWTFDTREVRAQFLKDHAADIYWYCLPEDDITWIKGPAWKIAAVADALARQEPTDLDDEDRW
jgi:hypothetical protein